jgi:cation diffusion facilitator CzcD-associated flavoprotein CzcO
MKKDAQYFETVIIGTGFSGLLAAIGLQKKNFNDFALLERSANIGGTWRDNAYPGAEVDIPTGLYSISYIPYQFKKKYSPQSELLEYTNHIIEKFGIRKYTSTNQSVTRLTYDESKCLWDVEAAVCWQTRIFLTLTERNLFRAHNSIPHAGITMCLMQENGLVLLVRDVRRPRSFQPLQARLAG